MRRNSYIEEKDWFRGLDRVEQVLWVVLAILMAASAISQIVMKLS